MTPREIKVAMRAQKKALRERVAQLPAVKAAKRKRQLRSIGVLVVLLLVLLFIRCDCGPNVAPSPVEGPDAGVDAGVAAPKKPIAIKPAIKPPPLQAKTKLDARDGFGTGERSTPSWLDGFRLQVSARSPRLAECFKGNERPGALRWSTSLNPESGAVSDQAFEPVGTTGDLTTDQQRCLAAALASPRYSLVPAQSAQPVQGLPSRVSLIIEF